MIYIRVLGMVGDGSFRMEAVGGDEIVGEYMLLFGRLLVSCFLPLHGCFKGEI